MHDIRECDKHITRRLVLRGGIALGALLASGLQADAQPPSPLRVAVYKGASDYDLLFQSAGVARPSYPVKYAEFASGNLIVEAINAGALDFGGMSEIPPIFVAGAKPDLRIIAVLRGDVNSQVVLVPRGSTIRSIADLKGKRVGYVRATTCHYYLLKMLEQAGLSFNQIVPVNLSPADGLAAFSSGNLDAWAIYGYSVPLAVHQQGARVLKTANGYLSGNYLLGAHRAAIADPGRHAEIADYLRRLRQAYAWQDKHAEDWSAVVAKVLGLPQDLILEQLKNQSSPSILVPVDEAAIKSQQAVADTFAAAQLIPSKVDVSTLWDRSFTSVLSEAR